MRQPVIMLSNTTRIWESVGPAIRADSYFGSTDGLHTISVHYHNFVGGLKIQGTLSLTPTEDDWFDISLNSVACSGNSSSYVQYPRDQFNPTGVNGDTGVDAFTFIGNFTFLRAALVRSYLGEVTTNNVVLEAHGSIDRVLLSL